jgi:hypothetical protein
LYVIGDNNTITNVNAINGDLAAVGSGLRLVADIADNGVLAATTANHQVVSDPLTAGVGTFTYGGLGISLVTGGQALFLSSDGVSPFVAVERPSAVPEPTGLAILGVNILGMLGYMRIHRSRTSA